MLMLSQNAYAQSAVIDINIASKSNLNGINYEPIKFGNILIDKNYGTVRLDKNTCAITWSNGIVSVDETFSQCGLINFIAPYPGNVQITYPKEIILNNTIANSKIIFHPEIEMKKKIIGYNESIEIKIGGLLEFKINTNEGFYNGSIDIMLDYIPLPNLKI